jgi:hypothetical protein
MRTRLQLLRLLIRKRKRGGVETCSQRVDSFRPERRISQYAVHDVCHDKSAGAEFSVGPFQTEEVPRIA